MVPSEISLSLHATQRSPLKKNPFMQLAHSTPVAPSTQRHAVAGDELELLAMHTPSVKHSKTSVAAVNALVWSSGGSISGDHEPFWDRIKPSSQVTPRLDGHFTHFLSFSNDPKGHTLQPD